ncbi:phosphatase 2A regulatory B subunit-domain-containing protein [Absidia repens]|uniref:Serine/threonine-protein phosphatase 2A 56 kDa regulatory subunit n=1 Tax=Absidia repens TaxID=90262 RepID=A0A1X2I8F3_9FUNG|nr:phosphatase 2A regulatory B subunit-domain-containing protein [Absidia repens]
MIKGIKGVLTRKPSDTTLVDHSGGGGFFTKPKLKAKHVEPITSENIDPPLLHPMDKLPSTPPPPPSNTTTSPLTVTKKSKKHKKQPDKVRLDLIPTITTTEPPPAAVATTAPVAATPSSTKAPFLRPDLKKLTMNKIKQTMTPKEPKHEQKKRRRSSRFHIDIQQCQELSKYPGFQDVPPCQHQELFYRKLAQCMVLFDFNDPVIHLKSKEIKRQALQEIVEYVATTPSLLSTESTTTSIYSKAVRLDEQEEEPVFESAWPHIQLVYEFFLQFLASPEFNVTLAKQYIDEQFILQLLALFDTEDPRERDLLKTTLHRIYGKFLSLRAFIRKSIRHLFYQFIYETQQFNGVTELLEILGSIINGFALPLKEEHRTFLFKVLMPLHTPSCLGNYHPALVYCVTQFMEKEPALTRPILLQLIKYWPKVNSAKQVMFLNELEDMVDMGTMMNDEKDEDVQIVCRQLVSCMSQPHFQVAERALLFWQNDYFVALLHQNHHLPLVMPILYPVLYHNAHSHWNRTVHGLSCNALKLLMVLDESLYEKCAQDDMKRLAKPQPKAEDRQQELWKKLGAMTLTID